MGMKLGDFWSGGTAEESICSEYRVPESELDKYEVLIAGYWSGSYSGSSWLLLREKASGHLYEVHGSHCSCFGLEDQFEPTETNLARLQSETFPSNGTSPFYDAPEHEIKAIQEYLSSLVA